MINKHKYEIGDFVVLRTCCDGKEVWVKGAIMDITWPTGPAYPEYRIFPVERLSGSLEQIRDFLVTGDHIENIYKITRGELRLPARAPDVTFTR